MNVGREGCVGGRCSTRSDLGPVECLLLDPNIAIFLKHQ